jgi:hypothetical protein
MRGLMIAAVLVAASPAAANCKNDIDQLQVRVKTLAPDVRGAVRTHLAKATKIQPVSEIECNNEITRARRLIREGLPPEPKDPLKKRLPDTGKPYNSLNPTASPN